MGEDEVECSWLKMVRVGKGQKAWVLDVAASVNVCKDQAMFDTLYTSGEYSHI